jgi:hypothetical protein
MTPKWNQATWYSRLLALGLFLIIIPIISFRIGREFENSPLTISPEQQTASVMEQASKLLAEVTQIQSHKYGTTQTTTTIFTKTLKLGSTGTQVTALQKYLISKGFLDASSATGYFGKATRTAVIAWQKSVGISPASGIFGDLSRKLLNSLISPTTTVVPVPTQVPTPTPTTTPVTTGTVKVIVVIDNTLGGTADSPSFQVTVVGGNPVPATFAGNGVGTSVIVNPNTQYSVNISSVANYTPVKNNGCTGTVVAGNTVTCSIINVYTPPIVNVPTVVIPVVPVVTTTPTTSQAKTYFNQNFEGGVVSPLRGGGVSITNEASYSGSYSAKMVLNNLATGPRLEYTFSNPSNPALDPNGFYQHWYLMMPASTITTVRTGQVKLLLNRFNVNQSSNFPTPWLMLGLGAQFLGGDELAVWRDADTGRLPCNNGRADGSTGVIFQPNKWYEMETYYKRDAVNNLGQIKLWVDGQLVCSSSPDPLLGSSLSTSVMDFWVGGVYTQGISSPITVYVDDVSAANTFINPVQANQTPTVAVTTPAPTVTISASPTSITGGNSSTLTWSSTNATSCTASSGWTGAQATSGSTSVSPTTNTTYSISCTGTGGTSSVQSATVTVSAPVVTIPSTPGVTTIFQDDFESGNFNNTQNGVRWSSVVWIDNTTNIAHGGTHSARFKEGDSSASAAPDGWSELRFDGLANLSEVYMQYYLYMPSGNESPFLGPKVKIIGGANDKFFRLWGGGDAGYGFGAGNATYPFSNKVGASTWGDGSGIDGRLGAEYSYSAPGTQWGMGQGAGPTYQYYQFFQDTNRGRWVKIQIHAKNATPANNDGVIQIWVDSTLVISYTNLINGNIYGVNTLTGYTTGYVLGWANNGWPAGQYVYMDDFSISTGGFTP